MSVQAKRILLVEGKNDLHVVAHLWKSNELPERHFEIIECGSDNKLLDKLKELLSASEESRPEKLGVVLDADSQEASARLDAVKSILTMGSHSSYANYVLPDCLNDNGIIISGAGQYPDIGIWVMPDNLSRGMLEDFLAKLAPVDAMEFAKQCVKDAKNNGFATFKDVHQSKSEIHTYLAWQDEPGNPLGTSIAAKALNVEVPVAIEFIEFLKNLFSDNNGEII